MSILLAIDYSSCGAPARGSLARAEPRRAAPRGARRNDGRGGLYDRGPNRAAPPGSRPPRAARYLRGCDADDGSRAVGPWPLTCDGRQQCRRDSLHADGHGARSRPARSDNKAVARLPVVLPGASAGLASHQRVAPGEGTKATRVPLFQNVPFASEIWRAGCPNAANPDTEPSARPSYGPKPALARRRCEDAGTAAIHSHRAAAMFPPKSLKWRLTTCAYWSNEGR
jgi:hypothetical protein